MVITTGHVPDDGFDPTDERFLRSRDRTEVPREAGVWLSGHTLATADALRPFLGPTDDPHAAVIPFSSVIVEKSETGREVLYDQSLVIDERTRNAHTAVWGRTGAGKTSRVIQNLLVSDIQDSEKSVWCFDLKGDQYPFIAALCENYERELLVINLARPERCQAGVNVLQDVSPHEANAILATFAEQTANRDSHESRFWEQMKHRLAFAAWCAGRESFAAIGDLFGHDLIRVAEFLHAHGGTAGRSMASFLRGDGQNAQTSVATLVGALNAFESDDVRRCTSSNELNFQESFAGRAVVLVECPEDQITLLRPVYNILIQRLLDEAVRRPGGESGPISIFLDDLPSWGPIDNLPDRLSTLRSRRIAVTAGIQSMASLRHSYGRAADLVRASFATSFVLPSLDAEDATLFSQISGECERAVQLPDQSWTATRRTVLSAADISHPRHRHFVYGPPATVFSVHGAFQAYLWPAYDRPDLQSVLRRAEVKDPDSVLRDTPLIAERTPELPENPKRTMQTHVSGPFSGDDSRERLEQLKGELGWDEVTGSARKWWDAFEQENIQKLGLVVRLAEELVHRQATITEFFLSYVYSNTDNIQANLHYLDYTRLKKEEERKKREAAAALRNLNAAEDQNET